MQTSDINLYQAVITAKLHEEEDHRNDAAEDRRREEEQRRRQLAEEAEQREEQEKEKLHKLLEEAAHQKAIADGWGEAADRVAVLRRQLEEEKESDTQQHMERMLKLNRVWDEKMAALDQDDKADEAAFRKRLAELKAIAITTTQ